MAQDLFYYETGYIDESYFVYIADAEASVTASSSVSCDADVIAGGVIVEGSSSWMSNSSVTAIATAILDSSVSMSSAFTQTAMISHIEGVDLFAMSNAALAAEVSRIRDNNIAVSSVFSISTDASRTRNYSSEDAADFTIAVANQRVRFNEAALDAAFSLTSDNLRNRYADSAISSISSVDVTGLRLKSFTSDLTASSTVTCDGELIAGGEVKEASADLSSSSSITIENSRLRSVAVALSTAVTQTSTIDGTLQAQASLTTTVNLSATISHIEGADLSAFTNAALSSQAVKITDTSANVSSNASTSTQANRLRDVVADLSTAVTQQTDANRLRDVVADLSASTTVSADVNETVQLSAALSADFTQSATISHIEGADLSAFTDSSLAVGADRLRGVTATITASVTQSVLASNIQVTTVSLSSAFAQTTSATRIQANSISLSSAFTQSVTGVKFTNFFTIEIQDQPDITNQWYSNPKDLYVDASGNMYSSGGMGTGSTGYTMYPSLTKVNKFGEHQWTKTFITSASDSFTNIVVDSSGNLYTLVNGSNTIIKYNTDGTVVWRYNTSNTTVQFRQIAIDTSDNIIAVGGYTFSSAIQGYVVKINSAGALQWNKRITGDALYGVIVDGTNIYTNNRTSLIKLDSTGAHVWTRTLSRNGSNTSDIYSLGKDSSGNIYAAPLNSGSWYMLVKYDSSGNKLWHRDYSGRVHDVYDSGTDVFILTAEGVGNINPSNGSVIWNKSYGISGDYFYTDSPETSLLVSNDGLYYTGLRVSNVNPYEYSSLILRFPTDGSGIPTFGTYTVNALTDTTTSTTSIVTTAATVTNLTGITLTTNTTTLGTKTPIVTFNAVNPGGYLLIGAASIASTSTLTGTANIIKLTSASISSSSSITAQPDNNLKSVTANITANGFVVAAFGRIRPDVADLTSAFSLSINAGNLVVANANLTANTSLTAQAQDLDLAEIALTATTALTFNINVVKSAQASISVNAVQTTAPVKTARITKALTATATLTASVLDLDLAVANLSSSFALRATANRWYPRPNGYWDSSIGYQPQWNDWNKLRVQDIAIAPSSSPTGFSETLVNFGGYLTITRTYAVSPTRNYLYINGVEYDISGEIGGGSPTLYDLSVVRGAYSTFGSRSFTAPSFDGTTSYSLGGSIPANAKFEWDHSFKVLYSTANPVWKKISSIGTYSLIYRSVAGTNFGVSDDVTIMLVTTFNTSLGTYSGVIVSNSFSNAVIGGDIGFGPTFTFAMNRDASSVIFTIQSNYLGENSSDSIPSFMNLAFSSISPGTYYSYDIPNSGYLIVESDASDILFTDSAFSESSIVSQYPYVLNDQTGVLGLYDSYGSLDRTGLVNQAQVALSAVATQTTVARKLISMSATLLANFTQASTVRKIARTSIPLQVTAAISPTGRRVRFGTGAITATASLSVTAKKYNGGFVTAISNALVNAQPYDFTKAQAALTSSVTANASVLRIKQLSAEFTAFYVELTAASKNATGTILLESTSTLTCAGVITADQPQYMFSQTQMTTTGVNTQFGAANISSTSTFNLVPTYLRRNESVMTVTTSVVANNSRTRTTASTQVAQAFVSASTDNSKITGYTAALTATSQMTTNNQILRLAQANLLSTSAMPLAFAGILVRFEANLQVNGFQLTAIDIINIDLFYQLKIPSETRTLWIEPESRILSIDSETRVNKIKGYPTP